jgi:hypothetical protein
MFWLIMAAVAIVTLIGLLICLWKWEPSDPRTDEERFAGINDLYTAGHRGLNRSRTPTDGYQLVSDVGFRPVDVDADLEMIAEIRRNLGQEETDG